jgi:hypothetical protein
MTLAEWAKAYPDSLSARVHTSPDPFELDVWRFLATHRGWPARDAAPMGTITTVALVLSCMEVAGVVGPAAQAAALLDGKYGRTVRAGVAL